MSLLEVGNLNVQFHKDGKKIRAVKDLSFHVGEGEIVGVIGESGCGKSTAMRALMGLLGNEADASCERFCFLGEEGTFSPNKVQKKMAMIFQDPFLYLNPTVKIGKQIEQAVRIHSGGNKKERRQRVCDLLEMAGIRMPKQRMSQYPHELSGGMRQRVVTAIALACNPKLIIADEPTTALDVIVQGQMILLLKRLAKETKAAVLLVSHDFGVIASMCERVYVMKEGTFIEQGTVEEIFYAPQKTYTKDLLKNARRTRIKVDATETEEVLLKLSNVTKLYPNRFTQGKAVQKEGVQNISFAIREGETFGLIGESGCGKSTLAEIITGQKRPDAGEMYYRSFRTDLLKKSARKKYLEKIQMVFQDTCESLNPRMTAGKALTEALKADKRQILTAEERKERAVQILKDVGLAEEDMWKYPKEFSGGQRQRVCIARALIRNPELLVCDEAVSALDVSIQTQILRLLKEIQRRTRIACLFISHDLEVVGKISQNVGVMYLGNLVECGNTQEICTDPWHPYTKQLLECKPDPDPKKARRKKYAPLRERQEETHKGCPYLGQCSYRMECCEKAAPPRYQFGSRKVACFLYSREHRKGNTDMPMTSQI